MHTTGLSRRLSLAVPAVLAVCVGLAAAPAVAAPEATAGPVTVTVRTGSGDLNVRSAPSTTSPRVGTVRDGSRVVITCHARGTVFSGGPFGSTTNLWNRLADGGYVTDAMLVTGSDDPVVPLCASESIRPVVPDPAGATVGGNPAEPGTPLWGALEKWYFASGKRSYPAVRGVPRDLVAAARRAGWAVVDDPRSHALVVIPPGVLDAPDAGHVAWVDATSGRTDGVYLRITEMGAPGTAPHVWSGRTVKAHPGLSYIPAQ